jgi:hypothetical protein
LIEVALRRMRVADALLACVYIAMLNDEGDMWEPILPPPLLASPRHSQVIAVAREKLHGALDEIDPARIWNVIDALHDGAQALANARPPIKTTP